MDPFKYREIVGTFTARLPDGGDSDQLPDRVPLNGYGTLRPNIRGTSVVFTEAGEFAVPRTRQVAFVDGELMVEVVDGESSILQPLFLEVTVDERANQEWSWTLTFDSLTIGEWGEEISHPALSFPVEEGDGPLELSTVATTVTRTANFVTRGPRGYRVTEVSAANGELVFAWEDGRTDSIPMPEAVQGVGVAEATQPYDGGLAFDLTDGTTTSSVSLPAGPPGRDGANVLPGRTTVLSEAWQPDLLAVARERSPYRRMTVTQNTNGTTLVTCHADDDAEHSVSYQITAPSRYRIIGEVRESGTEHVVTFDPDPNDSGSYPTDQLIGDATLTGSWNTSSTYFTTEVGAGWEVDVTTTDPGDTLHVAMRKDNRGGMWKVELVGTSVSTTFSGYLEVAENGRYRLFSVPTPGTYKVKATFLGADPNNPPDGGTARGWMVSDTWPSYFVRVSSRILGSTALSPGPSNKNWALRLGHPDNTNDEFFPYHGQDVETILDPPKLYDGATPLSLATGETVEVGSLSLVQHIMCHASDRMEDELIEVWTVDTIYPDGTYRANGRVRVLHDLIAGISTYFGMLPFNPAELDAVVTPFRTAYPSPPSATGNTNLPQDEGLHSTSLAAVGDDPDVVAVVRFNNPEETRRMSVSESSTPTLISHRDSGLAKIYPRVGYNSGSVVPAGTVWRFSADYWFGRSPGVRHLIE